MARSLGSDTGGPSPPVAGQIRLLASATMQDISHDLRIHNFLGHLYRLEWVLCLHLRRRRYHSQTPRSSTSFLDFVQSLPAFQRVQVNTFEIKEFRAGREWRRKPREDEGVRIEVIESLREQFDHLHLPTRDGVPLTSWAPGTSTWNARDDEQHILILHPWGADAIQLVQLPEIKVKKCPVSSRSTLPHALCSLCESKFQPHGSEEAVCVFHPGVMHWFGPEGSPSSDSDVASDAGSEGDNWANYMWTCCHREQTAPGCIVEARHLTADNVSPDLKPVAEDGKDGWVLLRCTTMCKHSRFE